MRLQIFVSSPGDVAEERVLARRVIERLRGEFAGRARLEPVFWEHEPLLATSTFQEQIVRPAETDVVVCILWSRLGTRLPPQFTRADGSRYESGTEFEFEDAAEAYRDTGRPELLVYRKRGTPVVRLDDRESVLETLRQKEALDAFVDRWFHDRAEGTLTAAFHGFDEAAQFEELLELHLRKLIEPRLPDGQTAAPVPATTPRWTDGSPFRGLESFDVEHAPVFFGRTRASSEVIASLRRQAADDRPFVLVLGASGSGKSSLVRAGVVPLLTQPGVIEGIGVWRRAILRPGDVPGDPLASLAAALVDGDALPELLRGGSDAEELREMLQTGPMAAVAVVRAALARAAADLQREAGLLEEPQARLVLVVDQLEELFSVESTDQAARRAFAAALDALVRSGEVWAIATLRSDMYPAITELPALVGLKESSGQYDLLPPTGAEIGQIVRNPAHAAGLRLEVDHDTGERLEDTLRDAAVRETDTLPLLEFALAELYRRRTGDDVLTIDAYQELGGVEGALAHRAETVFGELPTAVQDELPRLVRALVRIDVSGRASAAPAPRALLDTTPESTTLTHALVDARLLVTDLSPAGEPVVRLAHEALLRRWPRLAERIDHDRDHLRLRARLAGATGRWREEGRSPDYLWTTGKPLVEAKELAQDADASLHADEWAFLDASIRRGHRATLLRRGAIAALALLTLATGTAAFQAARESSRAQREAQQAQNEAQRANEVTDFLMAAFDLAAPERARGEPATVLDVIDAGAARVETELVDQPVTQATLMNMLGKVYLDQGRPDRAERLFERALEIRRRELGPSAPALGESLANLGVLRREQGRLAEAERLHREAIEVVEATHGPDSPLVATDLSNLANVLSDRGELDEAERLLRRVVELRRPSPGADRDELAVALNNLAAVTARQGEYAEAEALYEEALGLQRDVLPSDHPDIAATLGNLGQLHLAAGALELAELHLRQALDMERTVFGKDAPQVARTMGNLATVLQNRGEYEEAGDLLRDAIEIEKRTLGDDHPKVAATIVNLSLLRQTLGDYATAASLLDEALAIYRELAARGDGQPSLAVALVNRGSLHQELGDPMAAERLYREALDLERARYGDEHPEVAATIALIASARADAGDYSTSADLHREALALRVATLGPDHPDVALSHNGLATALWYQGNTDSAEEHLRQALAITRAAYGDEHVEVATILSNLGLILSDRGTWDEAEDALEEAMKIHRAVLGEGHASVAYDLKNLASLALRRGDIDPAARHMGEALRVGIAALGTDHPFTIDTQIGVAFLAEQQGDVRAAESGYLDAIEAQRRTLPANDPELARILAQLGAMLLREARSEDARPHLEEALRIRRVAYPEDSWEVANARSLLGEALAAGGQLERAEPLLLAGYEGLQQALGDEDARTVAARHRLAQFYAAMGEVDLADRYAVPE